MGGEFQYYAISKSWFSRRVMTRKTKELDHEKLVTVILVPLSERHAMVENMSLIHPWNLWNVLRNKDWPWRTGEASHRTDSLIS
jgi:hypothetical protein